MKISDGVIVATPPQFHAEYANLALEFDTPTLVEKPLALDPIDAAFLYTASYLTDTQLAVGHTALFADDYPTDDFTKIRAHRSGNNPGYHGLNAWWDLGVHDVAVCVDQFGRPARIEADISEEVYHVRLYWEERFAELTGNRNSDVKEWWFQFDGMDWTPYDSQTEPLKREVEWWLSGGSNPEQAQLVVETLHRANGATH